MPEYHKLANIYPMMQDREFENLVQNIKEEGYDEDQPVVLFEEQILDGRNRYEACLQLEIEPHYKQFEGDYLDALRYVRRWNSTRRDLDQGTKAMCFLRIKEEEDSYLTQVEEQVKTEAKERQEATFPKEGQKGFQSNVRPALGEHKSAGDENSKADKRDYRADHDRKTSTKMANLAGVGRSTYEMAQKLREEDFELSEQVANAEISLFKAYRQHEHEKAMASIPDLPTDKYRVVYADPPWQYGSKNQDQYGPAERHYPTMSIEELCALEIKDMVYDDAVLFLWVTSPLLDAVWPVIKAWGFKYKSSFVWDKVKHNYGHYNSVRHELLLVCTRGKGTPDNKKLYDSVLTIERTSEHSQKPEEFREIIDILYPYGKRVELFARTETENWDTWGSE